MSEAGSECEETDGFYSPSNEECRGCDEKHKEICKLFAIRRGISDEEKFKNNCDALDIVSVFFNNGKK